MIYRNEILTFHQNSPDASQLNEVGPPLIHINQSELVMRENQTLEITCTGGFNIEWVYTEGVRSRVLIIASVCPTCTRSAHYTSTLSVHGLEPQDSGQFQCIYSRLIGHINPATASDLYVFVAANGEFSNSVIQF